MARTKTKDAARLERLIAAGRQVHVIGIVWSLGVLGAFQFFTLRQWKKPSADVVGTWTPFAVTAPIAVVLLLAFMPRASQFR